MDSFFNDRSTIFIPIGGSGEIGSNLNLYGYKGKWLMLDCGVSFGDGIPGIDTTMPNPTFAAERRDDILGLVVTHGHEDHLGAIEYIWDQFMCPVYTTPFTAALLRLKLGQKFKKVRIIEMQPGDKKKLGDFTFEFIAVTHSIPDAVMVAVTTPTGTILHTGDWKFDPDPLLGYTTDFDRLKELGRQGVLAVVGDSTNAPLPGRSGSEGGVKQTLIDIVKNAKQRVAITCFASNVARLRSAAEAARQSGRQLAFIGRSLWRMFDAAEECDYWGDYPEPLEAEDAGFLPSANALYVCTGCQGEERAALNRIADDTHPHVVLDPGDTVVFSSRDIPGNEEEIAALQKRLMEHGCHVITINENPAVHVSGHPAQEELVELYQMVRPKILVPVHGEIHHQTAHAALAERCQISHTLIPANGDVVRLSVDGVEKVGTVKTGKLGVLGKKLVNVNVDPQRHHGGS